MRITCPSCSNRTNFLIPLWVRVTFKIEESGVVSILHCKQLESLEDKLTDQGKTSFGLTCKECGAEAKVEFNEYETPCITESEEDNPAAGNSESEDIKKLLEENRALKNKIALIEKEYRLSEFREYANALLEDPQNSPINPAQVDSLIDILEMAHNADERAKSDNTYSEESSCVGRVKAFVSGLSGGVSLGEFATGGVSLQGGK